MVQTEWGQTTHCLRLLNHKMQLAASIAKGIRGQITVNGKTYDGIMPALPMKDEELAAVSTYVLNMFGNKGGEITVEEIAAFRAGK